MKQFKLSAILALIGLFVSSILVISCEKNATDEIENQTIGLTLDALVEQLENATAKEGNGIFVDFNYDSATGEVVIINKEEKELGLEFLFVFENENSEAASSRANYTVECDNEGNDGKDNWKEECGNAWACGKLVDKCIKGGGCANVCGARIITVPQIKTHFVYRRS